MIEFHIVHVEILMRYFNWIWSARFYFLRIFAAVCCCRFIHLTQYKCPFVLSLKAVIIIIIPTSHTQSRSLSFSLYSAHFNSSLFLYFVYVLSVFARILTFQIEISCLYSVITVFFVLLCVILVSFIVLSCEFAFFLYSVSFGAQMVVRTICY